MNTLAKFQAEAKEDTMIDMMNIHDKQMRLPAVKHKWISRLIDAKRVLSTLEGRKMRTIESLVEQMEGEMKVKVSKPQLIERAKTHSSIVTINERIYEQKSIIEYLERIEKLFSSMTWDYKNIIELMKLETT